jgi:Xaa-Pro dipeptidase
MHAEQRQETYSLLHKHQIDQALFARPDSIKWLTGFAAPVQVGLNLFSSSYPLVWYDSGIFTLIVVEQYGELAAPFDKEEDGRVVTYQGYTVEGPIVSGSNLFSAFNKSANITQTGKIGIESEYASDLITSQIRSAGGNVVPIDGWLEPLRMIKTQEELTKLRRNFALTDIGHAAARQATVAGNREIDVWNAAHSAIQRAAGGRVPLGNDCVVGYRQNNIGGWPQDLELRLHDSIIVDLSAILDGYWSDSCATYFVGGRTEEQEKIHRIVTDALAYGKSLIRPGAVCREIDQKIKQFITDAGYQPYPHHTGHGVGVSGHEAPRIVPYSEEVLQAGMVIMLEPGIYLPGQTGVRLEDAILITADGIEVLTKHDKS